MLDKRLKEKESEKNLSVFLPKNLLSDLDEIPFVHEENVIYFYLIKSNIDKSNRI